MNPREKIEKTENIYLRHLLVDLRKTKAKIWLSVARELSRPNRKTRKVNVGKISKNIKDKDTIVVPGKVLGTGIIDKSVKVAAFGFSSKAIEKITAAKGTCLKISEMAKKNPKGEKLRIIG